MFTDAKDYKHTHAQTQNPRIQIGMKLLQFVKLQNNMEITQRPIKYFTLL